MELSLKQVHLHRNIESFSQNATGDRVAMLCSDASPTVKQSNKHPYSLHLLTSNPSKSLSLTPYAEIKSCNAHFVLVDASGSCVFTTSRDSNVLTVHLFTDGKSKKQALDLGFKHPITAVHNLFKSTAIQSKEDSVSISSASVVSATGELALVQVKVTNKWKLKIAHKTFNQLNVDKVLTTSVYNESTIIIYGPADSHGPTSLSSYGATHMKTTNEQFTMYVVRFSCPTGADISSATIVTSSSVTLSTSSSTQAVSSGTTTPRKSPKKSSAQNSLLAALLLPHCAIMLLADGSIHIVAPKRRKSTIGTSKTNLDAWFTSSSAAGDSMHVVRSSKQLMSTPLSKNNSFGAILPVRKDAAVSTDQVDSQHVLICYKDCVSIWDTTYHVMHGMVRHSNLIRQVTLSNSTTPVICDDNAINMVDMNLDFEVYQQASPETSFNATSLAHAVAIKRKQSEHRRNNDFMSCIDMSSVSSSPQSSPPIATQAHVDAKDAITKAAHAGGSIHTVFDPVISTAARREMANLRAILAASNNKEFTKIRRNLMKTPSSRPASLFVTRCLIALIRHSYNKPSISKRNNRVFVEPLIDILASGAVSSAAVVQLFNSWPHKDDEFDFVDDDDEDDEDEDAKNDRMNGNSQPQADLKDLEITSIVDAVLFPYLTRRQWIMQHQEHILTSVPFNALEAVLLQVPDLTERDVVKVLIFAAQMCRPEINSNGDRTDDTMSDGDTKEGEEEQKTKERVRRARSLLDKAVQASVDQGCALSALREVPFDDVLVLVEQLGGLIDNNFEEANEESALDRSAGKGKKRNKGDKSNPLSELCNYRGVKSWLESSVVVASSLYSTSGLNMAHKKIGQFGDRFEGESDSHDEPTGLDAYLYAVWMSRAIDAHFTNFIMDPHGQGYALIKRSLETVSRALEDCYGLGQLEGMVRHLAEERKLPVQEHSLYKVKIHAVPPRFAGL